MTLKTHLRHIASIGLLFAFLVGTGGAWATLPAAPTIDSIVSGNGEAIITFTPGADNGSPITGYRYIRDDGSLTSTILGVTGPTPVHITVDAAGNVYTTQYEVNCVPPPLDYDYIDPFPRDCAPYNVWKTTPDGTTTIFETAPGGLYLITLDSAGNVYGTGSGGVWKITPDGNSTNLGGGGGYGDEEMIAVDADGNVYTATSFLDEVWKTTPAGISTILGTTGSDPHAIAVDAAGNVYTANGGDNSVSKITPDGISSILWTTDSNYNWNNGIALDAAGNVYTTTGSGNVWKITPDGTSAILGTAGSHPAPVALDAEGNVYTGDCDGMVWKITPDGTSSIFGETPGFIGGCSDYPGVFNAPYDIAVDAVGNVYTTAGVADNVPPYCDDYGCPDFVNVWKITAPASIRTYPASDDTSPITITGLSKKKGTEYLISLIAVNAVGESVASNRVPVSVPSTAPEPPTSLSAIPGSEQAFIQFDAGADNGSSITNYQYSLNGGAFKALSPAGSVSPITIPGLNNGTAYSIRLKAMNSAGDSVASAPVEVTLPAVTGNRMALTGNVSGVVTVSIVGTGNFYPDETLSITTVTSVVSDVTGDADITAITTYYGDIAQNIFTSNGTISVNTLSCSCTPGAFCLCSLKPIGVAAGTSPEFSADVCSGLPGRWAGRGLFAAELVMTASSAGGPGCQPPEASSAPQIKSIDYGNEEIYLTVSVSNNGSSPITSYNATCTDGATEYTGTSSTSRITVSGLTNGVSYRCSVTATNAAGRTSTASATSPPIVPEYTPVGLPIWLLYEASKPNP